MRHGCGPRPLPWGRSIVMTLSQERPMSPRTLRKRAALAVCALLALSACGAPAVSSSEICGEARPLLALVANSGPEGYAAQVDKWRKVLDMAKDAEDPALAEFARLADERSRNAGNYYSPLNQIMRVSCGGVKPNMDKACRPNASEVEEAGLPDQPVSASWKVPASAWSGHRACNSSSSACNSPRIRAEPVRTATSSASWPRWAARAGSSSDWATATASFAVR